MKTNKTWAADETAIIYHLLLFGLLNKDIQAVAQSRHDNNLLKDRTPDSVGCRASDIRKYISKQKGYVVSNYDLSERVEKTIKKASKILPTDFVMIYDTKGQKQFTPAILKQPHGPNNPAVTGPVKPQFTREAPASNIIIVDTDKYNQEVNDMAEVFSMAKDLGATEAEYKGVKIKY